MLPLSAFIITKNEESRLPACLNALKDLVSEIIVLDSGSTDRTEEIARAAGAKFSVRPFDGFGQQKYAAEQLCAQDWVLNLDADEVLSPGLTEEIRAFFASGKTAGYDGGQFWIKGVLPEKDRPAPLSRSYNRIRLYNKNVLHFPQHSTFDNIDRTPDQRIFQFKHAVLHYSFESLKALEDKARARTKFYFETEKSGGFLKNILRYPFEFIFSFLKCYVLRGQFASGWYGLRNAYIYAKYRHIRIAQRVWGRCLIA
ncbi:MAG: glycosyltransferase family 2 protein [Rhodospirillales bacterium]|nr:glycosyltransferase family 2 protein [Rhodospirillales bacterium]MCB9979825.1 glycosyltransferase family 2 protein [Rhodospirillales bacterium]